MSFLIPIFILIGLFILIFVAWFIWHLIKLIVILLLLVILVLGLWFVGAFDLPIPISTDCLGII